MTQKISQTRANSASDAELEMIHVLFVCHGNICRSTMAEYVFKDMIKRKNIDDKFYVDSAATSREEIGNPVHYGTRRKLEEQGIYCGDHRARQITKEDYEVYDYLIGMDEANIRNMHRMLGAAPDKKMYKLLDFTARKGNIADPWYTGNFDETYKDVVDGCEGLLCFLQEKYGDFLL